MSVSSDLTKGVLTGSGTQDTIRTGAGSEFNACFFRNYSGGDVTLIVWENGIADSDIILDITLETKGSINVRCKFGSGDDLRAEAGAATSISWKLETDLLT